MKEGSSTDMQQDQLQHPIEQIPNSSRSVSSRLIPPVTTHRHIDDDELNKNIGSEYQDIQIRTLTKWMNVQLGHEAITSLDKDLRDGTKLLKLLAVVANQPNGLKPEKGNMRIHQLSNVAQALKFLQEQWGADSLPAVAGESIVNGDVKSTLAITFFIMLKYQIHPILLNQSTSSSSQLKAPPPSPLPSTSTSRTINGGKSMIEAKLALLYWVRSQLEDYVQHHIISTVQDFSRSWRSGLAFCLLLHRHDPDLLPTLFKDHIQHASDKETWKVLLNLAFQVAEQQMNIPKYLEPADLLVEYPHEPSVMMYVSEMYKVMSKIQQDTTEKRMKRLQDIQQVAPHLHHHSISSSPPESAPSDDDESPGTPQPELLNSQDVYQELNTLSDLMQQQPYYYHDNQKPDQLLDHIQQMIHQLEVAPEEKQGLTDRYHQLRNTWEALSKIRNLIPRDKNNELVHPLDGTLAMAETFQRALSEASEEERIQLQPTYQLFQRGVMFAQITSAINDELNVIEQLMVNSGTSSVTDQLVQSLEQRIHVVSTTILGVREEYEDDLLIPDDQKLSRFIDCMDSLEDRYETIRDWVDQVRSWFAEAERIRTWIDKHIQIIQERNEADAVNPVSREISIADSAVMQLHQQHERLKQEIEYFDADDMDRLRAHVKMLTQTTAEKELTPADTSTIEITLTTLNMLSHLTKLLDQRSHWIQLLLLRVRWEDLFAQAVQWIACTDGEMDNFLRGKARWSEKEEGNYTIKGGSNSDMNDDDLQDEGIESVIKTLVSLERKIADFDRGEYSDVLDAYQEMETIKNEPLPDYLEARQLGFEKAFEDLMKRSGFSRKVVEQLLSMINTVDKFKELRNMGEALRQILSNETSTDQDDDYAEKVQLFKEESARLITNASSCIPYPAVPEMSTAIGANDAHDNDITNQNIKSTISAYSMSLALIADGLDQLLTVRYQISSLQQRAEEAFDAMGRVRTWMEERTKLLKKTRFDTLLYDASISSSLSGSTSSSSIGSDTINSSESMQRKSSMQGSNNGPLSSTATPATVTDNETLARLEKERDSIAMRLHQIESDELSKLYETVRNLEYDVDTSNAVSIDRDALVNDLESLETVHGRLKDQIALHSLQLDTLKHRIDWENQWHKTNSHLQTVARKLCDLNNKKARYDPAKENADKPSYQGDHETSQSLQFLQDRVTELGERHMVSLAECFAELTDSYTKLPASLANQQVPDFIINKQDDIKFKFDDLKHLYSYTADLLSQRSTITEFLMRAQDAAHEGEKIKDIVIKKTRRIMMKDEVGNVPLDTRVSQFKQEIVSIWEDCGKNMAYPVYNGNWLRSLPHQQGADGASSNSTYRFQVRSQIKAMLDKKMDELHTLEKSIDQLLDTYRDADRMKSLVNQYEQEACELGQWINENIEVLKQQHIDVSAESFLARGMNIADLKKSQVDLLVQVDSFEESKVKTLHDRIAQLMQESMEKKKGQSVDPSSAARHLGDVMEHLSQLKRGLSDQAITLEAANMRAEWEKNLQLGITRLEEMNEQLRQFTAKKNQVIAQDEISEEQVQDLQQNLARLTSQKSKFQKSILPGIQLSYDTFVEYFPKLSRPMATPDHLEARMESLGRTAARFQENVEARSKELELIKQRMRWEDTVKQALSYLSKQENQIEVFVEEKARWQSDASASSIDATDNDEEVTLRTEWSDIYNGFQDYQERILQPLQQRYESLVDESTNHFNNTNVTLLPSAFEKKMQDIHTAQDRASYYLNFSNDVVTQRCLVSAFILRTAQLEQSAELIREEFIVTKVSGESAQIAGLLESHTERLEKFRAGIEDVRRNLASSIPYPVRSLNNVSTQAKIKDEATNAVIHDTVDIRNSHLEELWSSLHQILESKERISSRQLSLHSFKKQAEVTEAWIRSHHEILDANNDLASSDHEQLDIEKLKDAVSQADSVEQAMKANETVLSSLNNMYNKCIAAFEDKSLDLEEHAQDQDYISLAKEVPDMVIPTHKRINYDWNILKEKAVDASKCRTILMVKAKIDIWYKAVLDLQHSIHKDASDTQLSLWSSQVEQLEGKDYQHLRTDVETSKTLLNEKQADEVQGVLEKGKAVLTEVRTMLSAIQNELHLAQLIEKYLADISKLQQHISACISKMDELNEQHKAVDCEGTPETRQEQHLDLVSRYKQATDNLADLKDTYEDINEQHKSIEALDQNYSDAPQQVQMAETWSTLINKESLTSTLVARTSQWVALFDSLHTVRNELLGSQSELNAATSETYNSISKNLEKNEYILLHDLSELSNELTEDIINSKPFYSQCEAAMELLKTIQVNLKHQMSEEEKTLLIESIRAIVAQLCKDGDSQLESVDTHCSKTDYSDIDSEESLNSMRAACSLIIDTVSSACFRLQNELDSLKMKQCAKLVSDLGCSKTQTDQLLEPIVTVLNKLSAAQHSEKVCISLSNLISQYLTREADAVTTMKQCRQRLENNDSDSDIIADETLESIKDSIQELNGLQQLVANYDSKELLQSEKRMNNANKLINNKQEQIDLLYGQLIDQVKLKREAMEKINKRQYIMTKIADSMEYVADTTERVNAFRLTGKGIASEEKELEDLCNDFEQTWNKKSSVIEDLIVGYADIETDSEMQAAREQLDDAYKQLMVLIGIKRKEASDEGDMSEFLSIMETFDSHIASLLVVIEDASPHHSRIVNNKFVKSELQALLKTLVTTFKQSQITTNNVLDQARKESKKQFLGNNDRVAKEIQRTTKKWNQAQAFAAARERELQTCISQLDHEFFTKLAIAKSTPRSTRKVLVSPTTTVSTKKHTGVTSTNRFMGRASPLHKREDTHSNRVMSRVTMPTSSSMSRIRSSTYVPDPENELDMKLGHIVNNSPYRVTVKIVPGQVGKYWFGDVNPRLVYCRILPSQLVMVRVGGGWVELSKFLRDHGLTEGSYSRPESANETASNHPEPYQEAYLHTMRSSSPSGRVTIRGGGGVDRNSSSLASTRSSSKSSGSRSRSPLPGYVEGDKFISLDEAGNQIVVKMKKAQDDAKMPVVKKKKQREESQNL